MLWYARAVSCCGAAARDDCEVEDCVGCVDVCGAVVDVRWQPEEELQIIAVGSVLRSRLKDFSSNIWAR